MINYKSLLAGVCLAFTLAGTAVVSAQTQQQQAQNFDRSEKSLTRKSDNLHADFK